MFIIPGFLIAIVTFPGIVVHELGHLLFCRLRKVAVLEVCFLRLANPPGYVVHEIPGDFTSTFLITIGPFLLNSLTCLLVCLPAFIRVRTFNQEDPLSYVLLWLGVSIGMHAFPSNQDAEGLLAAAKKAAREFNLLALASYPVVLLIYVANVLRFFWLDYIYGAAVGLGLPELILKAAMERATHGG
jgi:hypothetical protein